jgi:hypothetical protein
MCRIGDVFVMQTPELDNRETKHCIYISISKNYLLYVNEFERPELFDGLLIKKSNKNQWLDKDRYVGCRHFIDFNKANLVKCVGRTQFSDIVRIRDRLQNYVDQKHKEVVSELNEFIAEGDF